MANLKFKEGDRVRIKAKLHGHQFKIGEIVTIEDLYPDATPPYYSANGEKRTWFIEDDEIEPDQMTFRPYAPPLTDEQIEEIRKAAIPKKEWAPEFPNHAWLMLPVQIFKDYGNGWIDVCDDDGNCLKVSKKNLHKPFSEYCIKKEDYMKQMKDAVLAVAKNLLKANNTVTTLEVKTELRRDYPYYFWTQQVVSDYMAQFAGDGIFSYTDNGVYRTYSLATPAMVVATAGPVSKSLSGVGKTVPPVRKKRGRPSKTSVPGTSTYVVSELKIAKLVSEPGFESISFGNQVVTKDAIKAQKKSPKGYLTPAKIARATHITISGITYNIV